MWKWIVANVTLPSMHTQGRKAATRTRYERLLYLDYDGVLHSDNVYWKRGQGIFIEAGHGQLFEHAGILERALEAWPDTGIVLSTSWVPVVGYAESVARLPEALRKRIVGATWHSLFAKDADMRAWWDRACRYETILADVARRGPRAWLAIDDTAGGWAEGARLHLVHTDSRRGLGGSEAELAAGLAALHSGQLDIRPGDVKVDEVVTRRIYDVW